MNYGLDTSALLRLLVGEPEALAQKVNDRLASLIDAGHAIHISDLVLSEAYYALQTHYGLSKDQALSSLDSLQSVAGFKLSTTALRVFETPRLGHANPGFVDRLIAAGYETNGETTISCEKSFSRLTKAEVIRD